MTYVGNEQAPELNNPAARLTSPEAGLDRPLCASLPLLFRKQRQHPRSCALTQGHGLGVEGREPPSFDISSPSLVHWPSGAAGALAKRVVYKAFGEQASVAGPAANDNESKGFVGERADPESGLNSLNARYYDATLGLFVSPDWFDPGSPASAPTDTPTPRETRSIKATGMGILVFLGPLQAL